MHRFQLLVASENGHAKKTKGYPLRYLNIKIHELKMKHNQRVTNPFQFGSPDTFPNILLYHVSNGKYVLLHKM